MKKIAPGKDQELWIMAAKHTNSSSNFRDLAELNQIKNPLEKLPANTLLNIPEANDIIKKADPILSGISTSVKGYTQKLTALTGQVSKQIESYTKYLPPELKRYTDIATKYLGEVNGVIGKVETELDSKLKGITDSLRKYGGQSTRLVDWLLIGSDKIGVGNVSSLLGKFLGKK